MNKSRKLSCAAHVATHGEREIHREFWLESLNGRDRRLGINGRVILKWILRNRLGRSGLDLSG
jgi:hypothetical protein